MSPAARAAAMLALAACVGPACSREAEPGADAATPVTAPAPSAAAPPPTATAATREADRDPAVDPAVLRRAECARVTAAVNDGAKAVADLEKRRGRMAPDEYLDAVARELERLSTSLMSLDLETKELADFARAYAEVTRRAAVVSRDASAASLRGHTEKLAAAEADMEAATRAGQPLLEKTARFCRATEK